MQSSSLSQEEKGFESINRLREHLIAFYAHHDPIKLRKDLDIDTMVRWADKYGLRQLNQKLFSKYEDQIDVQAKLGTPQERILRLCYAFTPNLSPELTRKTVQLRELKDKKAPKAIGEDDIIKSEHSADADNGDQGDDENELLKELYVYYLEHNKNKLQYLHYFMAYAEQNGREALDDVLIRKYGVGLPSKTQTLMPIKKKGYDILNQKAKNIMGNEKFNEMHAGNSNNNGKASNMIFVDEELKEDVQYFMEEIDPEKLKAGDALYVWTELMGRSLTSKIFLRMYGEALKTVATRPGAYSSSSRYESEASIDSRNGKKHFSAVSRSSSISSRSSDGSDTFRKFKKSLVTKEHTKGNNTIRMNGSRKDDLENEYKMTMKKMIKDRQGNKERHMKPKKSASARHLSNRMSTNSMSSEVSRYSYSSPNPLQNRKSMAPKVNSVNVRYHKDATMGRNKSNASIGISFKGQMDARRDSYLENPSLFMRNIPNVALSQRMYKDKAVGGGKQGAFIAIDYDDDTRDEKAKMIVTKNANINDILNNENNDALINIKKPKLSQQNSSGLDIFGKSKRNKEKKKMGTAMKAVFAVVGLSKPGANKGTIKPKGGKLRKIDLDKMDFRREEDIQQERTENADLFSLREPLRPNVMSVAAGELKNTYSTRLRAIRGSDEDKLPKQTRQKKDESLDIQNIRLPIHTLRIKNVDNKAAPENTPPETSQSDKTLFKNVVFDSGKSKGNFLSKLTMPKIPGSAKNASGTNLAVTTSSSSLRPKAPVSTTRVVCDNFVLCNDPDSVYYEKCDNCGINKDLHRGHSFDENAIQGEDGGPCRLFVGKGNICETCKAKKLDHSWYAFDLPVNYFTEKKTKVPGDTPLTDAEI